MTLVSTRYNMRSFENICHMLLGIASIMTGLKLNVVLVYKTHGVV